MSPVSVNFSPYPSVHRRSAAPAETREMRAARSTTLDSSLTVPPPRHRARKDNPQVFLQALIEAIAGRTVKDVGFFAEGPPRIIGVDDLANNAFDDFLGPLQAALGELGLVGPVPRAREDDSTRVQLRARALGVRPQTKIAKATPRTVRRFDEFVAPRAPTGGRGSVRPSQGRRASRHPRVGGRAVHDVGPVAVEIDDGRSEHDVTDKVTAMDEIVARSLKDDTYETDHLVDHDHSRALPGGGEGLSPSERK